MNPLLQANPFEIEAALKPQGKIDEFVFAKLKQLKIEPAKLCSDAVFLRRVYLDTIGTLPTVDEAKSFLDDQAPDKRSVLIDRLLERPEFADYWAMKWSDLLRVKAEFPINLWPNAAQAYHRWIRTSLKENMPYDQFVRELLTACGSNFRTPQVNFYPSAAKQRAAGDRPGGCAGVHGSAGGELAERTLGGNGRLLLPDWLQAHSRVERRDRLFRPPRGQTSPRTASRLRPSFPTAPRPSFRRGRIHARCLPIG